MAYAHHLCDDTGEPLSIVHRDVSPANLLLTKRGHVKVADFGIARCTQSDHRTDDGHVRGKLGYMSPEQAAGAVDRIGPSSDQYSLGVILYELLTGQLPFAGSVAVVISQVLHTQPAMPTTVNEA
ncbi:MAG: protein kinase, partial [Myxococcales bacterium]|nr:protein kinase [Myxococcales bacterium]